MLNQPHLKPSPLEIDFELDKDLLEVLLDQLISLQPKDLKISFDNTKQLFLACEKWEIEEATTGVFRQRMYDLSESDPWDLLVWAAERNDEHMARAALEKATPKAFARGRTRYYGRNAFWKSVDDLPPSWQWRLLRAALDNPTETAVTRIRSYNWTSRKKYEYTSKREDYVEQDCWPYREPWNDIGRMFEERRDEHFDIENEDRFKALPPEAAQEGNSMTCGNFDSCVRRYLPWISLYS